VILSRIKYDYMPPELDQLLNQRGTVGEAINDLARFTGFDAVVCERAVQLVYGIGGR
jgi:hypothetical protein